MVAEWTLKDRRSYELLDAPQRRLRRWPRRSTLGSAADNPFYELWPVLDEHRWPWEG